MKQTTLLAGALALACFGCARTEPAANADGQASLAPAPAAAQAAAPAQPAASAPAEYEFYLLPRDGKAPKDPRIVSTQQDHPCGPIDLVRVSSMPMNDPVFVPTYVVEFDSTGKELAKWGIPSEAEVTALDGQRLQFQVESGRFWVTPDGQLEKLARAARAKDFRTDEGMFDCPKLPTFANSGAEQCFKVNDAAQKERLIAMEGVCS